MSRPTLFVSVDHDGDYLVACEFGRVCDAVPDEHWEGITEDIGLLHDGPGGPVVGLGVQNLSEYDPAAEESAPLWSGARFDAPLLGLVDVPAGAVIAAARDRFQEAGTFNRFLFNSAIAQENPQRALQVWRSCLGTGDMMAHYGIGYTLLELGQTREAYHHLRFYTELAPHQPWAWRYRGVAADAIDEPGEARRCYRRAIALTAAGGEDTDADELLEALNTQPGRADRRPRGRGAQLWGDDIVQAGRRVIEACEETLAAGIATPARGAGGSPDAVAALRFPAGELLACAKGHGGSAASHAALRTLLDELADIESPGALTEQELTELWEQVRTRLSGPADLEDGIGTSASLTIAIVCCGAVLWSAVGDPQLAFVGERGSVSYPDRGSDERLDWQLSSEQLESRLRTGSYPLNEHGSVVLHSQLAQARDELAGSVDAEIPADMVAALLLCAGDDAAAVAVAHTAVD